MKKLLLFPLVILFIITSCEKDPVINPNPSVQQPPTPPTPPTSTPTFPSPANQVNIAPKAFAGSSKFVALPADSSPLYGGYSGNNVESYFWKYISGPASYVIEKPQSLSTKVYNLIKGIYEFELTVINRAGLSGKDTVTISVYEATSATKEIILKDAQWYCPMGCSLEISDFNLIVPVGTFFRVFIKRDNSTDWIEVIHIDHSQSTDRYIFGLDKNRLWIYSGAEDEDTPDVKIIF